MNEGWLNPGADYVMVRIGLDEELGLVTRRREQRATVLIIPVDHEPYSVSWPLDELRPATALEIYEHGEARLKRRPLGAGYGANGDKTMWDIMSDRDRDYWRSLRPAEEAQ